jgi:hypothetical protein
VVVGSRGRGRALRALDNPPYAGVMWCDKQCGQGKVCMVWALLSLFIQALLIKGVGCDVKLVLSAAIHTLHTGPTARGQACLIHVKGHMCCATTAEIEFVVRGRGVSDP